MYCVNCGHEIVQDAQFCGTCGTPVEIEVSTVVLQKRPIAGIVVAVVLGIIGVFWGIAQIIMSEYGNPSGIAAVLHQMIPALQGLTIISSSLLITGNTVLVISAMLAFLRHPNGNKSVRITSYFMIFVTAAIIVLSYFVFTESPSWQMLNGEVKGGLMGSLIGGGIGGLSQWFLVLFFFRKRRWG